MTRHQETVRAVRYEGPPPSERKTTVRVTKTWGILWRSRNKVDGKTEHLLYDGPFPCTYPTRREAMRHIDERYGYFKRRPDLQAEPHGWMIPRPVRIIIETDYDGNVQTGAIRVRFR